MRLYPNPQIHATTTDAVVLPHLIRLTPNLVIAKFGLMKLLPAKFTIEKALAENRLRPGQTVVETSSGTYALGLGMVCAENGINFHIVSDPAIDENLRRRLESLGGTVQIVRGQSKADGSLQVLRLKALHRFLEENPGSFWPQQYDNPDNQVGAYAVFAEQLRAALGDRFTLVGSVGSGGSTCGTVKNLRPLGCEIELVGVDTFGSVLFGLENGKRALRGLGNSIYPKNLEQEHFDSIHWVTNELASYWTHRLHQRFSLFCGPTTGATFAAAHWIAEQNPDKTVVFIGPDEGYRYQDSLYSEPLPREAFDDMLHQEQQPFQAETLDAVQAPWSTYTWGRRSLAEVRESHREVHS